jgi:hypothetical protein
MIYFLAFLVAGQSFASGPSLEYVRQLVSQDLSLTPERVLEKIGKDYPEMRGNYALLHESQSLQGASFRYPRVISYASDGKFALAFNGDPKADGYHELEMYEFANDRFSFQRVVFDEGKAPEIKPLNESRCKSCHGEDLRPNWESYNRWEGTYFETDRSRRGEKYKLATETGSHDGFDLFFTNEAGRGRYSFLTRLREKYVAGDYDAGKRIDESQLTQVAGYLNYRRIVRLMRASKDYEKYKYAILGALYDCKNFAEFFPIWEQASWKEKLRNYLAYTEQDLKTDSSKFFLESHMSSLSKWRAVFEGRDISMAFWSMSFRNSQYSFVTPGGEFEGFLTGLLIEQDPSLEKYQVFRIEHDEHYNGHTTNFVKPWTGSMTSMVTEACEDLLKASRAELDRR